MATGPISDIGRNFIRRLQRRILVAIVAGALLALAGGFTVATLYQLLRLAVSAPAACAILAVLFFGLAAIILSLNLEAKEKRKAPPPPEDPVEHLLQTFVAGVRAGRSAASDK